MDKLSKLKSALDDLANNGVSCKTAIINNLFNEIEHAINCGVTYQSIIDKLKEEQGLDIELKSFSVLLSRVRKRRQLLTNSAVKSDYSHCESQNTKPQNDDETFNNTQLSTKSTSAKPPGMSDAAWNELQVKQSKQKRKNQTIKGKCI